MVKQKRGGRTTTRPDSPRPAAARAPRTGTKAKKHSLRSTAKTRPLPKKRADRKPVRRTPTRPKQTATATAPQAPPRTPTSGPSERARNAGGKTPRLDRERRSLDEGTVQTPPSSLDMVRHGTAARSGRADLEKRRLEHRGMSPSITGGDVDVNVEDAYFTGDEAPGGDNPSPDLEVVDDIGKALGVQYDDGEELRGADKVAERDAHRWEMDPASAEDYRDRK